MKTIYLKDGRIADLITQTEKGYLVNPHIEWGFESERDSGPSGNVELVQEIFDTAPVDLIEKECQKVYDRMQIIASERDKLQEDKNSLWRDVEALKREKTNLSKLTFNRSDIKNAKRLVVFSDKQIAPVIYDPHNRHKLTLSIEITDYDPKIRAWIYKFYGDERYGSGDYFDEKYGVRCDLTDEEVMALNLERLASKKWDDWDIIRTDDKWLTPEFIERKKEILSKEAAREIETTKKEIEKYQTKLIELEKKTELTVS